MRFNTMKGQKIEKLTIVVFSTIITLISFDGFIKFILNKIVKMKKL